MVISSRSPARDFAMGQCWYRGFMTQAAAREAVRSNADEWIVRRVGDVARPRANIRAARDLGHLPGESGFYNGLRTIFGMFNRGNAFFLEKRRQFGDVFRTQFG